MRGESLSHGRSIGGNGGESGVLLRGGHARTSRRKGKGRGVEVRAQNPDSRAALVMPAILVHALPPLVGPSRIWMAFYGPCPCGEWNLAISWTAIGVAFIHPSRIFWSFYPWWRTYAFYLFIYFLPFQSDT